MDSICHYIIIALSVQMVWLVVLISFLLLLFYLRSLFIKRIGGITGDTIGASIELIEMNVLIAFVVAYFYIA